MAEPRLTEDLLAWYDCHARRLPWRAAGGTTPDPYRVWLSEIMLQQTTVAAVRGYFERFLEAWPSVTALADAPLERVLEAWAGLGYYARARNLHACARAVVERHGGRFPETEAELRALPGIGAYTAAAIAAIAFGQRAAAVDGNAERVIARLRGIETPLPAAKPLIREATLALVPADRPGDFAQALMDLGAMLCTPRAANCLLCPWTKSCAANRRGIADVLPRKAPKRPQPTRRGVAFWITGNGRVLLRRRAPRGLLGGMLEVPSTPWEPQLCAVPEAHAPVAAEWQRGAARIAHTFTHFHLELEVWRTAGPCGEELPREGDYRWVPFEALAVAALPSVMRKIAAALAPP
jgi:A/G-specific adenine glycosylase